MAEPKIPPEEQGHARLDDRIVGLLERDGGVLAFNGLRRALAAHPESLTRALRRLERYGVLSHGDSGYALVRSSARDAEVGRRPEFRSIGSVELPAALDRESVFGQLAGRWFGRLRWVGVYESPQDPWLVWTLEGTRDQVYLSLRGRTLAVGVGPAKGPSSETLDRAAVDLLRLGLARLLHPVDPPSGVATYAVASPPRYLIAN